MFKRTDKGGWVHLFCALLTLGVTFEDPDHLEGVVLKHVDRKVGPRVVPLGGDVVYWGGAGKSKVLVV